MRRKMAFFEIGAGRLAQDMQSEFETAQRIAYERRKPVIVNLKMVIFPPDLQDERFGEVQYVVKTSLPPKESRRLSTELKQGMIVKDGQDLAELLQEEIEFPDLQDPGILGFVRKEKEGGNDE